jgi:hypothetical protein
VCSSAADADFFNRRATAGAGLAVFPKNLQILLVFPGLTK